MFEHTSRYHRLESVTHITPEGREIVYKRRRFIPPGREMALLQEVTVTEDERLDLITSRTIGDPEQYWRVCDANDAMNPAELTGEPGRVLRVPVPQM